MSSIRSLRPSWWDAAATPAEFWKKYDAGEFGKPIASFNDPVFKQWVKIVAALPAEQQVEAVANRLQEINPGFDGKESHKIDNGVVTALEICTDHVTDISPVRVLTGLKNLACNGSYPGASDLSDLSPLQAMRLTTFSCLSTKVSDLSPLHGMPLKLLNCGHTRLTDISPLKGMSLETLYCHDTRISDLSVLKGMPLATLHCERTKVSDLSALEGMELRDVCVSPRSIRVGLEILRRMPSVQTVRSPVNQIAMPPEQFWKRYDSGEFSENQADTPFVELDGRNGFWGSPDVPESAFKLLKSVQTQNRDELKCFAFGPIRDWVFVAGGNVLYSSNLNLPACKKLVELAKVPDVDFKCVAFSPESGQTVLWNRNGNWSAGHVPEGATKKMEEVAKRDGILRSVAYGPDGAWVVMLDATDVAYGNLSDDLAKVLDTALKNHVSVRCVDFIGNDWICLSSDGWWTSNPDLAASKLIARNIQQGFSPKWIAVQPKGG
jgi:hypothetical protein